MKDLPEREIEGFQFIPSRDRCLGKYGRKSRDFDCVQRPLPRDEVHKGNGQRALKSGQSSISIYRFDAFLKKKIICNFKWHRVFESMERTFMNTSNNHLQDQQINQFQITPSMEQL